MLLQGQVWLMVQAFAVRDAVVERYEGDRERGAVTVEQIVVASLLALMAIVVIAIIQARITNKASTMRID